jgi:hypothetical protein
VNSNRKKQVGLLLIIVVIAALLAFVQPSAADDTVEPADLNDVQHVDRYRLRRWTPRVLSPRWPWYGHTYDEWAAKWWQWATDLPADGTHPLIADGVMDCSLGQEGNVWFLGGTYSESGVAHRKCKVPEGTALFFPVVNVICSPLVGDFGPLPLLECPLNPLAVDWPGTDFQVRPLSATIDGKPVGKLERYYTLSKEPFNLGPLPDPNILYNPDHPEWAPPGAEGEAATGGYYLLLPPLSKGKHEIAFVGEIEFFDPDGVPFYYFKTDITYDLKVVKE